ncbi:MAG TPA: DUF1223 domain-containing protein [Paracoccaceae bacterium]|nr:DUF1223 domain-containing protein [Paracoccaceae bacterium]
MLTPVCGFADDVRPTVIELYTSQGCSSCPPADALLMELATRDDVVALALHVDYWDYIGWKDTFADPIYSKRQKAYARARGEKMVYTPQIVVNGTRTLVGVDATGLAALLRTDTSRALIELDIERSGDSLSVRAAGDGAVPAGSFVQLVRYIPQATVQIERGENAGRSITYSNVVTSWQQVVVWDGTEPLDLTLNVPGDLGVAVLIQAPGPGQMVAAAALKQ